MTQATTFVTRSVVSTDGIALVYRTCGDAAARPLVMIHGWIQSSAAWGDELLGELGRSFRVIAVDLRGHGHSDKATSGYDSSAQWADDISAVLDDAGVADGAGAILLGWSYGGIVCGDYLVHKGLGRVGGLVMVCATSSISRAPGGRVGEAMLAAAKGAVDDNPKRAIAALASFGGDMFATPAPAAQQRLFGLSLATPPHVRAAMLNRRVNNDKALAALDVPALVIHGDSDGVVLPTAGEANAATLKTTVTWYEGVAHAPFAEAPERFIADLERFAAALEARGGTGL